MQAPEILSERGWYEYDKCNCGGTLKITYKNDAFPTLQLEWQPYNYAFKITDKNTTKIPPTNIKSLESIITTL